MYSISIQTTATNNLLNFQLEESSYGVQVNHTSQVANTDIRLTSVNTVQIQIKKLKIPIAM